MSTFFLAVISHCFQNQFQSIEHAHRRYLCIVCLSLLEELVSSCPPMKWRCSCAVCELHFWAAKWKDQGPPHRSVYSRRHSLRPAFPAIPPQPELQPWGPVASLSQIESQILLGRGNREAQDEWMARLCHVSVCWWMVRVKRTVSGGAAKSRVFSTLRCFAVILVLNLIFKKKTQNYQSVLHFFE